MIGQEIEISFRGQVCRFKVMQAKDQNANPYCDPNTLIHIVQQTKVALIVETLLNEDDTSRPKVAYSNIGGLEEQIRIVREMVETPLQNPQLFRKYGMLYHCWLLLH